MVVRALIIAPPPNNYCIMFNGNYFLMQHNFNDLMKEPTGMSEALPLLDSRLITRTKLKKYNIKVVDCGDYTQVYLYENTKFLTNKDENIDLELKKQKVIQLFNEKEKEKNETKDISNNKIEERNIIRSKLSCQRLAKANSRKWETFVTLTIGENLQDVKISNKKFQNFTRQIRRIKKDFSYIAIPEFQKRGAVHYHLLTNISIYDTSLIYSQEDNPKFKHIKYWNNGFTSVEVMKGDIKKIVGYISKYMTKDVDNRLFGFRRFLYSQNLSIPRSSYIDTLESRENDFYKKRTQGKELIYHNEYVNPYDNSKVLFLEFFSTDKNIIH